MEKFPTGQIEEEHENPLNLNERELAEGSLKTERGVEEYKCLLQLLDEDLEGKKILDIGSGPSHKFGTEAEKKYKDTKVVSLDYSFDQSKLEYQDDFDHSPRGKLKIDDKSPGNTRGEMLVKGFFTRLPFKIGSFDLVVSSAAIPLYLSKEEEISKAIEEVIRVLKEGGKARLGPVSHVEVVDTDYRKNINETHRQRTMLEGEGKKLLDSVMKKFKNKAWFRILQAVEKNPLSPYSKVISPPVLEIIKKKQGVFSRFK